MTDGKLQWHTAFHATMTIEMGGENEMLQIEAEHLLAKKPMQIDLLIIKKKPEHRIEKNIGRIFKTYNIIEYKSPDDYLSVNDFYKVYGYTCFYQSDTERVNEIDPRELTLTFVGNHYPAKLLKHIRKVRGITPVKRDDGIYELIGDPFAMQVIVINELSKEKNYWLQTLRKNLQSGGEIRELLERYEEKKNEPRYQALMNIVVQANREKVEEERKMCEALREIFADDLREAQEKGQQIGQEIGQKIGQEIGQQIGEELGRMKKARETARNLAEMGMSTENIAKAVGMQESDVKSWLAEEEERAAIV